jgi:hypothetical protein
MRRLILSLCLMLLTAPLFAQEETSTIIPGEGWTLEQRCVGEATTPSEDWTFEGTIFAYKLGMGFHALRSDVPTPYYLAFNGSIFNSAGAVSPDGLLYAVPAGEDSGPYNMVGTHLFRVKEILIYRTTPAAPLIQRIPHKATYASGTDFVIPDVVWINNDQIAVDTGEHVASNLLTIDLRKEEVISTLDINPYQYFIPSPDLTQMFAVQYHENAALQLIEVKTGNIVREFPSNQRIGTWSPDSSKIVSDKITDADKKSLLLLQRDRLSETSILTAQHPPVEFDFFTIRWSLDSSHFAFRIYNGSFSTLHVVDVETKTIIDTCITNASEFVLSPNGKQVAIRVFKPNSDDSSLSIIDLEEKQMTRLAADNFGYLSGWYPNEKTER